MCVLCDEHQLLAVGSDDGTVQCWDPRSNTRVGLLNVTREGSVTHYSSIYISQCVLEEEEHTVVSLCVGVVIVDITSITV